MEPSEKAARPRRRTAPIVVLVAEDDLATRRLVTRALRKRGYSIIEATDGDELYDRIQRNLAGKLPDVPDLIISDVHMPGRTGLEVLEKIRKEGINLPFILVTAFGDQEIYSKAEQLGAFAVLDKPFDITDLLAKVNDIVGGAGGGSGGG